VPPPPPPPPHQMIYMVPKDEGEHEGEA